MPQVPLIMSWAKRRQVSRFDLETPEQIPGYSGSYVIPKGLEENVIKLGSILISE